MDNLKSPINITPFYNSKLEDLNRELNLVPAWCDSGNHSTTSGLNINSKSTVMVVAHVIWHKSALS